MHRHQNLQRRICRHPGNWSPCSSPSLGLFPTLWYPHLGHRCGAIWFRCDITPLGIVIFQQPEQHQITLYQRTKLRSKRHTKNIMHEYFSHFWFLQYPGPSSRRRCCTNPTMLHPSASWVDPTLPVQETLQILKAGKQRTISKCSTVLVAELIDADCSPILLLVKTY